MDVCQYVQLPDGTYAALCRSLNYGQAVIILLLVALVFLQLYEVWRHTR